MRLYHSIGNNEKAIQYGNILHEWNQIRDNTNAEEKKPLEIELLGNTADVVDMFFTLS